MDQSRAMYAMLTNVNIVAPAKMRASTAVCPAKVIGSLRRSEDNSVVGQTGKQ